jgi:flagellar motor switch protein FliN/FliY
MKEAVAQPSTHLVELSEFQPHTPSGPTVLGNNPKILHGVKVTLSVVVGQAQTTLGELMDLKEQSVLKVNRQVDYPVDVMVDGHVVARGQLVVVDDHFGVRLTEIAQGSTP